jgi:hypothetical protein
MANYNRRLNLTRNQLSEFLTDHEQIKQFERLFAAVDEAVSTGTGQNSEIDAGIAIASANQNAADLYQLAQELSLAASVSEQKAQRAQDSVDNLATVLEGVNVDAFTAKAFANMALSRIDEVEQSLSVVSYAAHALAHSAMQTALNAAKDAEAAQMIPPAREFKRSRYGSFYDTTTQTATAINTATKITFNTTDLSHGVSVNGGTQIQVDTDGIYNYQLSIQLDKTAGGTAEFFLWFRLNGANVTNSASQIRIQGNNSEIFSSLNYFFNLKSGDYVEVMYSVSDLSVQLLAVPAAAPHPGIPSIILTVSNNIGGIQ